MFFVMCVTALAASAQSDDFGIWTSLEIQKKIDKMREEAMAAAYTKNAKAAWEEYANAEMKAAEVKDELALKQEKWTERR